MDRTARLIEASGTLRRRIWASMPLHHRVADFFSRVAVSTVEAFGKTVYGEFLTHGIEDMPEINGSPASEFDTKRKPIADRLPRGYGKEFGKLAFLTLMKKFHLGPDTTERIMLDFLVRFLDRGSKGLRSGESLKKAEQYVMTSLVHDCINHIRRKKIEISEAYFSGEDELHHDLPVFDEDTVERQLKRFLPKVRSKLEAIHEDAPLYVQLSIINGYTDREIIGDEARGVKSKLPHPYSKQGQPLTDSAWGMSYKPKIFDVLRKNFADLQVSV